MIKNIVLKLIKRGISIPYFLYCLEFIPEDVEDMEIFNEDEYVPQITFNVKTVYGELEMEV